MAILSPSILSADFANLERDIHNIEENGADWVHAVSYTHLDVYKRQV